LSGLSSCSPEPVSKLPGIRETNFGGLNDLEDAGMPRDLVLPHNPFHLTQVQTGQATAAPLARKRKKLRPICKVSPQSPTAILSKMISPQKIKNSVQMRTGELLAKGAPAGFGRTPQPSREHTNMVKSMEGIFPRSYKGTTEHTPTRRPAELDVETFRLGTERCQFVLVKPSIPKLDIPGNLSRQQALLTDKSHSSTFNASRKLMPLFSKIPYEGATRKLREDTVAEFNLSPREQRFVLAAPENDHIGYNASLAKNYKLFQ
jgi:hypothetical protein